MALIQEVGFNGIAGIISVVVCLKWTKYKSSAGVGFHAMPGKFGRIVIRETCFVGRASDKHYYNGLMIR